MKAEGSLHARLPGSEGPRRTRSLSSVPIGFFNVARLNREAGAPLGAPRGEHLAAAAGGHALAEPVHAGAAANLRLIRSFGHEFSFSRAMKFSRHVIAGRSGDEAISNFSLENRYGFAPFDHSQ
jgi:hypothetical protein